MKTKSIRSIFAQSACRAILVFELVFLGSVILSSCQIEKRHYMRGFFFGKPITSSVVKNDSTQICKPFANIADTIHAEVVPETNQKTFSTEGYTNDTVSAGQFLKEKEQNQIINSAVPEFSSAVKHFLSKKNLLNTIIPAHCGTKKLHPLAIIGLGLLGLSIVSFLLFALLWVPGFVLLLCLLFFILSIVAFIFAKKKMLQNKDKWTGIIMIKTVLTIELVLLCVFLIAFVTVWFLVITI